MLNNPRFRHSWLSPTEPSAPREDQPPAEGVRLVFLSPRSLVLILSLILFN